MTPWLGRRVEWFYGTHRSGTVGSGTVVAYSDQPQVLIEDERGEKIWWAAHLIRDVTCTHCGGSGVKP